MVLAVIAVEVGVIVVVRVVSALVVVAGLRVSEWFCMRSCISNSMAVRLWYDTVCLPVIRGLLFLFERIPVP